VGLPAWAATAGKNPSKKAFFSPPLNPNPSLKPLAASTALRLGLYWEDWVLLGEKQALGGSPSPSQWSWDPPAASNPLLRDLPPNLLISLYFSQG